jgi:glycosyltransferase involved in cell wall biosynthesis
MIHAMRKIGINAHLLSGEAGYRQAGIHTYISQLLNHLPSTDDLHYHVFTQRGAEQFLQPHLQIEASRWPTRNPLVRIAWEQAAWLPLARRARVDLLHSMAFVTPFFAPIPKIVTVYDLSFIHFPERYTKFKRWYLQSQTRRSVQSADLTLAISQDGKRDIQKVFGIATDKVAVITPGVSASYRPLPPAEVDRFKQEKELTRRFILHVGTLQPRKNIPVLLRAFAELNDRNVDLVLVGGKGWLFDEIFALVGQLNLRDRVRFTGFVPDSELPLWYNSAELFVFPSIYEGFGIPAADAMACGTPVIVANTSSLPEVVGTAGLHFEPQAVSALAERIAYVLYDSVQADTMREQGLAQARNFSWTQSGKKMAELYRQLTA